MTPVRIDRRHLLAGSAGLALATALGPLPARTASTAGSTRAVGVTATRRAGPAPLGLTLTAEATGFGVENPRHDLMYFWRTGDSGDWSALSDNMVLSRSKAERTGFSISHTYDTPGSYTVEVLATDGVNEATGTVRIEVADPDVFYARATHVVSQAGNFDGAPAGAIKHTTLADALRAVNPEKRWWDRHERGRVLLRAGEVFPLTGEEFGNIPDDTLIGSFGGGRATLTGQTEIITFRNLTVAGVRFQGTFDPTNPDPQETTRGLSANNGNGNFVIHDCEAIGLDMFGWSRPRTGDSQDYVISNCRITDWQVYGLFVDAQKTFGIVGCSILQNPKGYSGRTGGAIRFTGQPRKSPLDAFPDPILNIQQCEMFSNSSTWPKSEHLTGTHHQPCLRWNTTGALSISGNITGCIMEGGAQVVVFEESGGAGQFLPQPVVMEGNILVGTERTMQFIGIGHQGQTIRNNSFVWVDVPYWGQGHPTRETRPERFVFINKRVATGESTEANNAAGVRLHDNLVVDLHGTVPRDVWPAPITETTTETGGKLVFRFDLDGNRVAFGSVPDDAALSGYVPHYKAVGTLARARGLEGAPQPGTDTPGDTPVPLPPRMGGRME